MMGNGFMDSGSFDAIFFIVFGIIAIGFIAIIAKAIGTGLSNQAAELEQRSCKVVDKRTRVRGGSGDFSASTNYYVTFEFDGGERKELEVKDRDFGMIVTGDRGELRYKGTRFLEFVRAMEA
ncbi:hypothetical protein QD47_15355 [Paenibacillus terrae]|uniref:DUF2500 domain-containing protein n=2 Tax=Paenibacillus terrae TaxID=159743 RepID=A0A0D7X0L8_9BACL|nr:DUF2500 domain-containing protein [Paenibacillus terrae]KJD44744.1 hypothetical protein QD47_15355 [Paenibacillus terrae]